MIKKQYVSLPHVICKKIPLKNGEPLPFEIGKEYHFAQMGRIYVYYRIVGDQFRITDIRLGYRQYKECFSKL